MRGNLSLFLFTSRHDYQKSFCSSTSDTCTSTASVSVTLQEAAGMLLPGGDDTCTLTLTAFSLFTYQHSNTQPFPPGDGDGRRLRRHRLCGEGLSPNNAITRSLHPHSQSVSQAPSPHAPYLLPALLCSAPPFMFLQCLPRTHRLSLYMIRLRFFSYTFNLLQDPVVKPTQYEELVLVTGAKQEYKENTTFKSESAIIYKSEIQTKICTVCKSRNKRLDNLLEVQSGNLWDSHTKDSG
ncbi:hypothetical protein JOB18_035600 [Solea senegalensis]|uniref:Uncharacterized protein n=1 Tax=Solea senegalensis TaxID=28829 RepID=A0AAV6SUH4_SOLSE|nr:hypothetical protein JOB18_035600 [Solea senegalensis]